MPGWTDTFLSTIEAEIVPRLLALSGARASLAEPVSAELIEAVADAAVAGERAVVEGHLVAYMLSGATVGDALLNIVAPAARHLGLQWETDARDFLDVTVGLGALHQVLLALSRPEVEQTLPGRRILLGNTPGETHMLGLAIVDHFFRNARWDVRYEPCAGRRELVEAVGSGWYGVVGLSLSGETLHDEAEATVTALRAASLNRQVRVLVGGPAFDQDGGLAGRIGADAAATDGRTAVLIANGWLASAERDARP